jgi:hypothetical protein
MVDKAKMRFVSGIALLVAIGCVAAQGMIRGSMGNPPYFGSALIAVFTFLFLSSKSEDQSE